MTNILCLLSCENFRSYVQAVEELTRGVHSRVRTAFHQSNIIYNLSSSGRAFHRACRVAHEHTGSDLPPLQSLFLSQAHHKNMIVPSLRLSLPGLAPL